jgi:hypothetical protein
MANHAMTAKLERARAQARDAAAIEFTKPYYLMQPSKRELHAMVSSLHGVVIERCPSMARKRAERSYGDPARRGSILTADVYVMETRLIRRNEVSHA